MKNLGVDVFSVHSSFNVSCIVSTVVLLFFVLICASVCRVRTILASGYWVLRNIR